MMKSCHIQFEALADYHEGRSDAATAEQVRRHLDLGCPDCERRLEWLARFVPALHRSISAPLPNVSAAALELAQNIARERQPATAPLLVRLARLVFDSRQAQPAFGARNLEQGELQLVYSTEEYDVDLWQEHQQADRWYVIGQVLPKEGGEPLMPEQVTLSAIETETPGRQFTAEADEGEFTAREVPAGTYEVRVRLSDQEIVLPDVVIGSQA